MEGRELRDQANLTLVMKEIDISLSASAAADRQERIKIEFYKTYDVMTGIRIAATLGGKECAQEPSQPVPVRQKSLVCRGGQPGTKRGGCTINTEAYSPFPQGFFSMMILLVLYKNYCKPSKTLSEEQLNAAVTAAVEEEDRALKAALEATSFYTSLSKQRQLEPEDNPGIISPRFSSVGGGCSHFAPPVRFSYLQQRGKSLPGSALRFSEEAETAQTKNLGEKEGREEEEDPDGECQLPDYVIQSNCLSVPPDRRLSSITCSSADTSYLERRGSAFEMGLPAPPCFPKSTADKKKLDEEGPWDFYYPIDIQVIQPTPEISPAASAETLCEKASNICGLQVPGFHEIHRLSVDSSELVIAPLASISSLASLSTPTQTIQPSANQNNQNQESALGGNGESTGSDSVFLDEEVHTEDEVEEFSTDSEFEYGGFDDDYSFCESSKKPPKRCKNPNVRFASFDSCDTSLGQDTSSEGREMLKEDKPSASGDGKKPAETGGVIKRKLSKTFSEPKSHGRSGKQLPPWIERGRSGFVPKRQLSMPVSRGRSKARSPLAKEEAQPPGDGDAASPPAPLPQQGHPKEMPSGKNHEDKRKRLQKQKTVNEEWNAGEGPSDACPNKDCDLDSAKGRGDKKEGVEGGGGGGVNEPGNTSEGGEVPSQGEPGPVTSTARTSQDSELSVITRTNLSV